MCQYYKAPKKGPKSDPILAPLFTQFTLEGRLDEAEIAANFGLQKRCQG